MMLEQGRRPRATGCICKRCDPTSRHESRRCGFAAEQMSTICRRTATAQFREFSVPFEPWAPGAAPQRACQQTYPGTELVAPPQYSGLFCTVSTCHCRTTGTCHCCTTGMSTILSMNCICGTVFCTTWTADLCMVTGTPTTLSMNCVYLDIVPAGLRYI